jgi:hypothetical protein
MSCNHTSQARSNANCAVTTALFLSWSAELRMLVDTIQQTVLLPQILRRLLEKGTTGTKHEDSDLLDHLLNAYPLNMDETMDQFCKRIDNTTVKGPIEHLPAPVPFNLCMLCMRWVPHLANHHHRHHQGQSSPKTPESRLFIALLRPGGGGTLQDQRSVKVQVSTSQSRRNNSSQTSINPPKQHPPPPSLPAYPIVLGWQAYLASCNEDPESVLLLLSLTKKQPPWQTNPEAVLDALERFLGFLPKALQDYLHQADQRLNSSHESVRELVTYGCATPLSFFMILAAESQIGGKVDFALSNHKAAKSTRFSPPELFLSHCDGL